jgi:hypothetical protein
MTSRRQTPEPVVIDDVVETAIRWPSRTSSSYTRRCPQVGFSAAIRITKLLITAAVSGRPGRQRAV